MLAKANSRSHLFEGPLILQAFMRQEDLIGVAKFISACLHKTCPLRVRCLICLVWLRET